MKTTKRNKKDLIDIDIIDLNGSSKDGGKKKSAGKKTASAKKTAGGRSTASGAKASGRKASGRKETRAKAPKAAGQRWRVSFRWRVRSTGTQEGQPGVCGYYLLFFWRCLSVSPDILSISYNLRVRDFINNPYNARLATLSDTVIRGAHSLRRRTGAGQDGCGGGRYRDERSIRTAPCSPMLWGTM